MPKLLIALLFMVSTSFYSLQFTTTSGSQVNMSSYQGKKILIVNIATGSSFVSQLSAMQELQQQYHDSLVVLAFPSNSFGHEPREDSAIAAFCTATYHTTFSIAHKGVVAGTGVQPVYNWLGKKTENGVVDDGVEGDFQKYLISSSGEVIGVYSSTVNPMDSVIIKAVMRDL